ncbi:hypothetical protein N7U49_03375 [Streptomyces sp. AD2-2]|nr:hypothetical protein N7U49_03375 [Streptomyces sp. AD2-2]
MTQHQSDPAPATGATDSYLAALRQRLAADGTLVTGTTWRDRPVTIGSRSDRKASLIGRPITVETTGSGVTRVTMYRGGSMYGGMFTGHVLEKAALYFP